MPEINPVTKDQLFEKKIAENTGSNYNVGDISDVVPVTKDQALLKEIALNSAGQSGDITELEEKVADNTGAIEAIVNVNGCCNVLQNTQSTQTEGNVVFTVNSDGSVTADSSGQGADLDRNQFVNMSLTLPAGTYKLSGGIDNNKYIELLNTDYSSAGITNTGNATEFTVSSAHTYIVVIRVKAGTVVNDTFYPMVYDARLNPTDYIPYAMTNRELTDAVNRGSVSVTADGVKTYAVLLNELFGLIDTNKLSHKSSLRLGNVCVSISQIVNNQYYIFGGIVDFLLAAEKVFTYNMYVASNNSVFMETETSTSQTLFTNHSSDAAPSGQVITVYY